MPSPSHAPSASWIAFKFLVLAVGGAIAFWPDELRPLAWKVLVGFATEGMGPVVLGALVAVTVVNLGLTLLGHVVLPDEPTPRPDDPEDR